MRQDSDDLPLGKRGGSLRMGIINEQVSNSKLMVDGLTQGTSTQMLQSLFEGYPGYKDINHVV